MFIALIVTAYFKPRRGGMFNMSLLRSFDLIKTRFYKYFAPLGLAFQKWSGIVI